MSPPANDRVPKLSLDRTWAVLGVLGRHLWPKGEWGLRTRVVIALVLLVLAKLTNVYVPILYKQAVDALGTAAAQAVAVPIALILAYGAARVLAQALGEIRDAVFAPVSQRAIRNLALEVFGHLHALSRCASISSARPAASAGSSSAARQGMEFLIRFTTFNILPTLLEIALVGGILWHLYDWRFSAVTLARHRRLHRVLGHPVGMAHQVRAPHERRRHRGQRQGDRQPAELRDRQVFRQRGARGAPLRCRPPALRDRRRSAPAAPCRCSISARASIISLGLAAVMVDGGLRRRRRTP